MCVVTAFEPPVVELRRRPVEPPVQAIVVHLRVPGHVPQHSCLGRGIANVRRQVSGDQLRRRHHVVAKEQYERRRDGGDPGVARGPRAGVAAVHGPDAQIGRALAAPEAASDGRGLPPDRPLGRERRGRPGL